MPMFTSSREKYNTLLYTLFIVLFLFLTWGVLADAFWCQLSSLDVLSQLSFLSGRSKRCLYPELLCFNSQLMKLYQDCYENSELRQSGNLNLRSCLATWHQETPIRALVHGAYLVRLGRWDNALPIWRESQASSYFANWAGFLRDEGRFEECEAHLNLAIQIAPKNPEYQASLGDLRTKIGDNVGAVDAYKEAFRLGNKTDALTWWYLGYADHLAANFDQAIEAYNQALDLALMISPESWARNYYHYLAQSHLNAGNQELAIEFFTLSTIFFPEQRTSYWCLGDIYRDTGQFSRAEYWYTQEMKAHGQNAGGLIRLGINALRADEFQKATQYLEMALGYDQNNPAIYSYLGQTYAELQRYDEAQAFMLNSIQLDPDNPVYLQAVVDIVINSGRQCYWEQFLDFSLLSDADSIDELKNLLASEIGDICEDK